MNSNIDVVERYANIIFDQHKGELCKYYNNSQQSIDEDESQYAIINLYQKINKYLSDHDVPVNLRKEVHEMIKSIIYDPRYNKPETKGEDLSR